VLGTCGLAACRGGPSRTAADPLPAYLRDVAAHDAAEPREAARAWFRQARFGLMLHYSRRTLEHSAVRPPELSAKGFDADAIADLAVAAGMRYVNFTTYHGGGPFLFATDGSDDTSAKGAAGRDLFGELAAACGRRGLGLFAYVHVSMSQSHEPARDRRNRAMLRELLSHYGPLAGIWFDSVLHYYRHPECFPHLDAYYALIRTLQPQCLISFKYGATGEEDFRAAEHAPRDPFANRRLPPAVQERLARLPVEICTTLQLDRPGGGGSGMWFDQATAYHRSADEVMNLLRAARRHDANLLLNTGLRGDGSLHPGDADTLREVGHRLRRDGWPEPA
jgi:alpha-L-fucosidase